MGGQSGHVCEVCGAVPAASVTIRGHQGMLVLMRFLRRPGVFCRTCGIAVFRQMQANTMLQGWWGAMSLIITPITLLINLAPRAKLLRLPETGMSGYRPPLDPGKPVMKRPAGLVGALPLAAFTIFILLLIIGLLVGDS